VEDAEEKEVILEAIAEVRAKMAGEGVEDKALDLESSGSSDGLSDKLVHCSSESDKSSKTESGFHSTDDNDHCDDNNNEDTTKVSVGSIKTKSDLDSVPRSFLYRSKNLNLLNELEVGGSLLENPRAANDKIKHTNRH
jgi:hypothetical protein